MKPTANDATQPLTSRRKDCFAAAKTQPAGDEVLKLGRSLEIVGRQNGAGSGRFAKGAITAGSKDQDREELQASLERLRQEHRDLDAAIDALANAPGSDVLRIQRLKKRKLYLRDRMSFIEDQLTPDIIA
jgi:hypothetical protein